MLVNKYAPYKVPARSTALELLTVGKQPFPAGRSHSQHHGWCYRSGLQAPRSCRATAVPRSPATLKCTERTSGFSKLPVGCSATAGGSLNSNQYRIPMHLTPSSTLREDD